MKNLFNEKTARFSALLVFALLFSSTFVSSAIDTSDVDDVFKVNTIIEYTKPCINNGTWCSASAACNYTFYNRDNSVRHNNVPAISSGNGTSSIWKFNVTQADAGFYKTDMCCTDGTAQACETLNYQVTGSGDNNFFGFQLYILIFSLVVIVLGVYLEDAWISMIGGMGLTYVGLDVMFNGIVGIKDTVYTEAFAIILVFLAGYITLRSAIELMGGKDGW